MTRVLACALEMASALNYLHGQSINHGERRCPCNHAETGWLGCNRCCSDVALLPASNGPWSRTQQFDHIQPTTPQLSRGVVVCLTHTRVQAT
jgi:hypothetical protein